MSICAVYVDAILTQCAGVKKNVTDIPVLVCTPV